MAFSLFGETALPGAPLNWLPLPEAHFWGPHRPPCGSWLAGPKRTVSAGVEGRLLGLGPPPCPQEVVPCLRGPPPRVHLLGSGLTGSPRGQPAFRRHPPAPSASRLRQLRRQWAASPGRAPDSGALNPGHVPWSRGPLATVTWRCPRASPTAISCLLPSLTPLWGRNCAVSSLNKQPSPRRRLPVMPSLTLLSAPGLPLRSSSRRPDSRERTRMRSVQRARPGQLLPRGARRPRRVWRARQPTDTESFCLFKSRNQN